MIPKVIYYCWFGHNQKSKEIEMCMESWRKVCPEREWRIVEINETNFDINFCNFTREAYAQKKWAFVSDVARLWAIYTYGGYYFDTDVELLEPLDRFLPYDCWFASNDVNFIATGWDLVQSLDIGWSDSSWKTIKTFHSREMYAYN